MPLGIAEVCQCQWEEVMAEVTVVADTARERYSTVHRRSAAKILRQKAPMT
jgi:hypothetical protein